MKQILFVGASILLLLSSGRELGVAAEGGAQTAAAAHSAGDASAAGARTPVIVELFTSEGCSDCPPADSLLTQLEKQQPVAGAEIIPLEEHVDYWDRQGWVDPFSGVQWTTRQQDYAATRHDQQIYTPQMVVNGETQFVGSRERQALQIIAKAASQSHVPVTIAPEESKKRGEFQFRVTAGKLTTSGDHAEVWLAITETGLHSAVGAGENSGVDVHHSEVVRSLRKIGNAEPDKETSFEGEAVAKAEKSWKRENLHAVVFIQEKRSRHIIGAAETRFEQ